MDFLVLLITVAEQVLSLLLIAYVLLSYFMPPYHPIRQFVDQLVEPLLEPVRRVIPSVGMFDFSPLIVLILTQFLATLLIRALQ